jgi:diacylglycerol kinase family enzyme
LVLGLRTLFQGSPASLPVFRASFSPGAHIVAPGAADDDDGGPLSAETAHQPVSHLDGAIVASYGFHASVVYESDTTAYRVHGDKRFGMVAQELLRESHPYTAHVEIRRPSSPSSSGPAQLEALPRKEHAYVLTTLVSNLERAFTISPASKPLDGQLRTVHFGNIGGARAMEAMMKAYDGGKHVDVRWDDGERIYYEDVDEIRITVEDGESRWRKFCVDGTTVGVPRGGQMTVKRLEQSPLQILVNPSILKK